MKMKRVLVKITVKACNGGIYDDEMEETLNYLLKPIFCSKLGSSRYSEQKILHITSQKIMAIGLANWLPKQFGKCPAQFVLNAPAHLLRDDVPEYEGEVKQS